MASKGAVEHSGAGDEFDRRRRYHCFDTEQVCKQSIYLRALATGNGNHNVAVN
jgi:hypothetical protein